MLEKVRSLLSIAAPGRSRGFCQNSETNGLLLTQDAKNPGMMKDSYQGTKLLIESNCRCRFPAAACPTLYSAFMITILGIDPLVYGVGWIVSGYTPALWGQ